MIRRPPRSTRTDTLFPYTTLFRSEPIVGKDLLGPVEEALNDVHFERRIADKCFDLALPEIDGAKIAQKDFAATVRERSRDDSWIDVDPAGRPGLGDRSEESSVGQECFSPCISRWLLYRQQKKKWGRHYRSQKIQLD